MPNIWTALAIGTSASQASRSGSTIVWSNPSNSLVLDAVYAIATPMSPSDKTQTLKVTGNAPSPIIPTSGATLLAAELWITRHQDSTAAPGDGLEYAVIDDLVQISKSGSVVGSNLAQLAVVPEVDATIVYTFDPVSDGFSIADINAGLCGCFMGWACPGDSHTYDSANWSISYVPATGEETFSLGTVSLTSVFTITFTWIGTPGAQPLYVVVSLTGTATGTGNGSVGHPTNYTGIASVNNGLGGLDSGAIQAPTADPPPTGRSVTNTVKRRLTLVGISAQTTVTMVSSVTVAPASTQLAQVDHAISAMVIAPDPTELFVDAARIRYLYSMDGGIGFNFADATMSRVPEIGVRDVTTGVNNERSK